jgi:TPR repeat protein
MPTSNNFLPRILFVATFCGASVSIAPVFAAGAGTPAPPPSMSNTVDPGNPHHSRKSTEKKKHRQDRRSEQEYKEFVSGYHTARGLVLDGKYNEAIIAFRALGHDDHPDVANYIGYAYRKLGDYDRSKVWYDKALEANPRTTYGHGNITGFGTSSRETSSKRKISLKRSGSCVAT